MCAFFMTMRTDGWDLVDGEARPELMHHARERRREQHAVRLRHDVDRLRLASRFSTCTFAPHICAVAQYCCPGNYLHFQVEVLAEKSTGRCVSCECQ